MTSSSTGSGAGGAHAADRDPGAAVGAVDPADALRRLRARSAGSWAHGEREATMRAALQLLADLTAAVLSEPRRTVPDVGVRALADQLAVLVADADAAGVGVAILHPLLRDLFEALGVA